MLNHYTFQETNAFQIFLYAQIKMRSNSKRFYALFGVRKQTESAGTMRQNLWRIPSALIVDLSQRKYSA